MHRLSYLAAVLCAILLIGCGRQLPFPTPAQQNLVVLAAPGPLTYSVDDAGNAVGLEHDLVEAFAQELGVGVDYLVVPADEIEAKLAAGKAHLAIGWLPPSPDARQKNTPPILQSRDVIIQHEASLPLDELRDLRGKTVHALSGSRQLATLQRLQQRMPDLQLVEEKTQDIYELLDAVGNRKIDFVAIDSSLIDIAVQFTPALQASLVLGDEQAIVWWLGPAPNAELLTRASTFAERAQLDGTLARLEDRYFGHVRRLNQVDTIKFLERIETMLPKIRGIFQTAQRVSGIDWRLLAAVAYHESQWDSNATSPTGVRGIMMLTEETADRLGVSNRLDTRESILAGARYINLLRDLQPDDVPEPDRTWLALAAYNIGPGHFNAARALARQLGADPTAWYEMKRILPLLAQPKYYQRVKSSRARGGEAVILVENIRSYYDILVRNAPSLPAQAAGEAKTGIGRHAAAPGLKLKR